MSGNAKKWMWVVTGSVVGIFLLWAADVIQDFGIGITVAAFVLLLELARSFLPQDFKKMHGAIAAIMIFTVTSAFVVPAFVRIFMPVSVQRAWRTSSIATRMRVISWIYDPEALARYAHEEHCRAENHRLSEGEGSEIGKTGVKEVFRC